MYLKDINQLALCAFSAILGMRTASLGDGMDIDGIEHSLILALHEDREDDLAGLAENIEELPLGQQKAMLTDSMMKTVAIRGRLALHKKREWGLRAVIDTAQDLTAMRDIDQVLSAIVHRARRLIGCDMSYLSILDSAHDDFYVRATAGALTEQFKAMRVARDAGVCGYVARHCAPYYSADYVADPRFSYSGSIDSAIGGEHIRAILGVPMRSGSHVTGVLFVCDRYSRNYDSWEMSILSTLAAHASVAFDNARLFQEAQEALRLASIANALLAKQSADIEAAAQAQDRLASLVAKGASLAEVCRSIARSLHGRLSVIDEGEQEICSSAPEAGMPGELDAGSYQWQDRIHAALAESRLQARSVTAYAGDEGVCRLTAINGSRGMQGGLVIVTPQPLDDTAVRIFERSAVITGMVLLSEQRAEVAARSEFPILLRELLDSNPHDLRKLARRTARHGIDLLRPTCLVLIDFGTADVGFILNRLGRTGGLGHAIYADICGLLIVLVPAGELAQHEHAIRRFCAEHVREKISGVISKPVALAQQLPLAFDSLRRCLDLLPRLGLDGSIEHEGALSLYSVLFSGQSRRDMSDFVAATLGALNPNEDSRKTELAHTLLAYLDHGHNARAAAESLHIHINTFRQRLGSIDALIADWSSRERQLEVHMALRLWQLQSGPMTAP
jgi:GAF domain/PucR C-terminal helix-turn-helix domain